jgi:hypothetical protein
MKGICTSLDIKAPSWMKSLKLKSSYKDVKLNSRKLVHHSHKKNNRLKWMVISYKIPGHSYK